MDVLPGHEDGEGDAFRYLDIARTANEIVKDCLDGQGGMRPQVGWMGIGILEEGREVGVRVGSLRRVGRGRWWDGGGRVVDLLEGERGAGVLREVGVT